MKVTYPTCTIHNYADAAMQLQHYRYYKSKVNQNHNTKVLSTITQQLLNCIRISILGINSTEKKHNN